MKFIAGGKKYKFCYNKESVGWVARLFFHNGYEWIMMYMAGGMGETKAEAKFDLMALINKRMERSEESHMKLIHSIQNCTGEEKTKLDFMAEVNRCMEVQKRFYMQLLRGVQKCEE